MCCDVAPGANLPIRPPYHETELLCKQMGLCPYDKSWYIKDPWPSFCKQTNKPLQAISVRPPSRQHEQGMLALCMECPHGCSCRGLAVLALDVRSARGLAPMRVGPPRPPRGSTHLRHSWPQDEGRSSSDQKGADFRQPATGLAHSEPSHRCTPWCWEVDRPDLLSAQA